MSIIETEQLMLRPVQHMMQKQFLTVIVIV